MASPLIRRAVLTISFAGLAAIATFEGTRTAAYLDSVGVPTICTGHTKTVRLGDVRTLGECEVLLKEDTSEAGRAVSRLVKTDLTQEQYDALVSFTFNVGQGALARSTLLKRVNAGECLQAAAEFLRWDKAGGMRLRGLTIRRKAESEAFKGGCSVPSTDKIPAGPDSGTRTG